MRIAARSPTSWMSTCWESRSGESTTMQKGQQRAARTSCAPAAPRCSAVAGASTKWPRYRPSTAPSKRKCDAPSRKLARRIP